MNFILGNSAVRMAGIVFAVAVVLGSGLVLIEGSPTAVTPSRDVLTASNISIAEPSLEAGNDFAARPLFWEDRRPLEPVIVAAPSTEDTGPAPTSSAGALDKVKLRGTFATGGEAGVIANFDGQRYRLTLGDSLGGWTLAAVDETGAVFEGVVYRGRPPERRTLSLEHAYPQGGGGNSAVAAVAGAAANNRAAVDVSDTTVKMLGGGSKKPSRPNTNKGEQ